MFPSEFLDNTPSFFAPLIVRYVNGFVPCIGFERGYRFCVLEDEIGTSESKSFLEYVAEIWCDWIGWWQNKITNRIQEKSCADSRMDGRDRGNFPSKTPYKKNKNLELYVGFWGVLLGDLSGDRLCDLMVICWVAFGATFW